MKVTLPEMVMLIGGMAMNREGVCMGQSGRLALRRKLSFARGQIKETDLSACLGGPRPIRR